MPEQMKLNEDGFCLELTDNCRTEGLGTILSMLANEEMEHFNTIAFLEGQTGNCSKAKTKVQENVNTIFLRMKEDEADECFDYSELDYYRKTLNFEETSRLFYLKKAADAERKNERQLFLSLAGEVEKHQRILETILAFTVRSKPGKRLGNAERQQPEDFKYKEAAMEDDDANYETTKQFSSNTTAAGFHQGASASKSARCPSCDRDLIQPNLLHPAISRSCAKPRGSSRGHGICSECGGLGAGLLDGI